MAQVGAARAFGRRADLFAAPLAASPRVFNVVGDFVNTGRRGFGRRFPAALVSRLSFVFDAFGFCLQSGVGKNYFDAVLYFHPHAAGLDFTTDGERSIAIEASGQCGYLLALVEGDRAVGPDVLIVVRPKWWTAAFRHESNLGFCSSFMKTPGRFCSLRRDFT